MFCVKAILCELIPVSLSLSRSCVHSTSTSTKQNRMELNSLSSARFIVITHQHHAIDGIQLVDTFTIVLRRFFVVGERGVKIHNRNFSHFSTRKKRWKPCYPLPICVHVCLYAVIIFCCFNHFVHLEFKTVWLSQSSLMTFVPIFLCHSNFHSSVWHWLNSERNHRVIKTFNFHRERQPRKIYIQLIFRIQ